MHQVFAVHVSLISQLEVVGGMEEWALYVAQHLPDGPTQEWHGLRDQLVCPIVWHQDVGHNCQFAFCSQSATFIVQLPS